MESKLAEIKAASTITCMALAPLLDWRGILAIAWVAAMIVDYLSGTAVACKQGQWSSALAREGLWHKGGAIMVVGVSAVADLILSATCDNLQLSFGWPDMLLPLVLSWYLITELGSILENAVKLGAAVPAWLLKLMKSGLRAVEAAGGDLEEEIGDEDA